MPIFDKVNNIFLCYPAYCGGNHLINLLSLVDKIEPSFLSYEELKLRYEREIELKYRTEPYHRIAHFNEIQIPNVDVWEYSNSGRVLFDQTHNTLIEQQNSGYINVIQGHMHNWWELWREGNKVLTLTNPVWMFMTFPKKGPALERMQLKDEVYEMAVTFDYPNTDFEEDIQIYKAYDSNKICENKKLKQLFNVQPGSAIVIDTDEFFKETGFDYFQKIIYGYLGIKIPYDMGNSIHQLWRELLGIG